MHTLKTNHFKARDRTLENEPSPTTCPHVHKPRWTGICLQTSSPAAWSPPQPREGLGSRRTSGHVARPGSARIVHTRRVQQDTGDDGTATQDEAGDEEGHGVSGSAPIQHRAFSFPLDSPPRAIYSRGTEMISTASLPPRDSHLSNFGSLGRGCVRMYVKSL